jgi:ABC-type lipoprotein release transport system permease subunit
MTALKVGFFLAIRQIRRASKGTTVLIIFIMTITFLNLVVVSGILVGLVIGSSNAFIKQYTGGVIIRSGDDKNLIENSQDIIKLAINTPGVEAVSARYISGGHVRADIRQNIESNEKGNEVNSQFVGIDPDVEDKVTNLSDLVVEGEYLTAREEGYVMLGSGLLSQYSSGFGSGESRLEGVTIGSRVRVTAGENSKEVLVKGIVKSKIGEVNQRVFFTDIQLRKFIDRSDLNVNEVAIKVKSGFLESQVSQTIHTSSLIGEAKVQTSVEAQGQFFQDIASTFEVLGNFIGAIALSVASITVFIVIFINAVTRRKYIGIMKGIGVSGLAIEYSYVLQSIFYAVVGIIIGYALIFGLIKPYFDANPIDFPFSDGILATTQAGTLNRAVVLLLVTLIAGYLPARLIVKKNTLDSILGR